MGDRTWFYATVRKTDLETFSEYFGWGGDDWVIDDEWKNIAGEDVVVVNDGEINYGGTDACEAASEEGIQFHGFHGPGGDYPECVFVSHGSEFTVLAASEGYPVVRINEDGIPDKRSVTAAKRYWQLYKEASVDLVRFTKNGT